MKQVTKAIKYRYHRTVSAMAIYNGEVFKEWNGDALITSLKDQSLRRIKFKIMNLLTKKLFKRQDWKNKDIKIHNETEIYMLSDKGELWRMYK